MDPNNPPAFPVSTVDGFTNEGMTLRDWFAGRAIGVVITEMQRGTIGDHPIAGGGPAGFAATVYDIADAMLVARSTPQGGER